jgi:hypothetical protein
MQTDRPSPCLFWILQSHLIGTEGFRKKSRRDLSLRKLYTQVQLPKVPVCCVLFQEIENFLLVLMCSCSTRLPGDRLQQGGDECGVVCKEFQRFAICESTQDLLGS